jgi:V8-like Glu-specific endopeptidase
MGVRWRVSTGLALSCAAIALPAVPAVAQDASEPSIAAAVPQTPEAIRQYWTNERMRKAQPIDQAVDGVGAILGGADAAPAAKRGGAAASPVRRHKRVPKRTHGKVYLTLNPGGNFVCSGTVVNAPSDSLVITAGHCTFGCEALLGCTPRRATNFNFVPAFKNGSKPFGEWPARAGGVRATGQYENNENLAYDVGAAVIAPRNGKQIQDVVGARGIAFNRAYAQDYRAYGYPVLGKYSGSQAPYRCPPNSKGRDNSLSPPSIRIACDMTGGASGGGWVIDRGRIASVTSYGYPSDPNELYGPYFGSAIENFYNSVKND